MRQFFSFAFLSAISYLCHRVFDKSKWNTKDTAFKVDKSLPRLLPYAVCQIVRFDWNFCHQKVAIPRGNRRGSGSRTVKKRQTTPVEECKYLLQPRDPQKIPALKTQGFSRRTAKPGAMRPDYRIPYLRRIFRIRGSRSEIMRS